ncbi:MAG: methyl-accepting chemotaxis protein [Pseudomonadota bacterium]|nr:methyl-accepting chemotaxis protein [Pseudomonadota bacterium]
MKTWIETKLGNISLRATIIASLGAPLFLLWIAGFYTWSSWQDHRYAERTIEANQLSDLVIDAAGKLALERGTTVAALTAPPERRAALREQISNWRLQGEVGQGKARVIAQHLVTTSFSGPALAASLAQAEKSYGDLVTARQKVDRALAGQNDLTPEEWIRTISAHIGDGARVRMAAFSGESLPAAAAFDSLTVKHQAWLASEYAGLERGTLVGLINARQPIAPDALQRLQAYRQIADGAVRELLFLRQVPGADRSVIEAVDRMEKRLQGFAEVRSRIYTAAATGDFPVDGEQWFAAATQSIDGILAVSTALSAASIEKAREFSSWRRLQAGGYIVTFFAMLVVTVATALLLFAKLHGIERLRVSMADLAGGDGDLTRRLPAEASDEVGATSAAFNQFAQHLQEIVRQVLADVQEVSTAAAELMRSAESVKQSSEQQHQATRSTAEAVEQVSASFDSVAEHARASSRTTEEATDLAEEGVRTMLAASRDIDRMAAMLGATARNIDSLDRKTDEISGIVSLIHDIAEQTNLLALNAAIEAARAGEQGRGFAVVADEVRKLAERTAKATAEIGAMIASLQEASHRAATDTTASSTQAGAAVATIQQAARLLERLHVSASDARSRSVEIAGATQKQRTVGGDISRHVENIAEMAQQNAATVLENAAGAKRLQALATGLQRLVGRFRI